MWHQFHVEIHFKQTDHSKGCTPWERNTQKKSRSIKKLCLKKIKTSLFPRLHLYFREVIVGELNPGDQEAAFTTSQPSFRIFPVWKLCCPISGCVMDSHRYSLVLFTCVPKGAMLSSNHWFYNTFYTLAPFPTHLWSCEKNIPGQHFHWSMFQCENVHASWCSNTRKEWGIQVSSLPIKDKVHSSQYFPVCHCQDNQLASVYMLVTNKFKVQLPKVLITAYFKE